MPMSNDNSKHVPDLSCTVAFLQALYLEPSATATHLAAIFGCDHALFARIAADTFLHLANDERVAPVMLELCDYLETITEVIRAKVQKGGDIANKGGGQPCEKH